MSETQKLTGSDLKKIILFIEHGMLNGFASTDWQAYKQTKETKPIKPESLSHLAGNRSPSSIYKLPNDQPIKPNSQLLLTWWK